MPSMQATPPVGQASVIKLLRTVIFVGIEGAAVVYPRGITRKRYGAMLGWLGPLLTVHATDPLPAARLYIAVTPDDFRILGKAIMSPPFEIGRWKKRTYRASMREGALSLKLDLELETLGRVRLHSAPWFGAGSVRPVFDLVVQSASGPVIAY